MRRTFRVMIPLIYHPLSSPERLKQPHSPHGFRLGLSTPGAVLFGSSFVAAGVFCMLIGLRVIHPGGAPNAPHWLMLSIGATFGASGLLVWWTAWRQYQSERRRRQRKRRYPDQAALADYDWPPDGIRSKGYAKAMRATAMAIFLVLMLTTPNYLALQERHPVLIAVAGCFDLIALFVIGRVILLWGRAFKFGQAVLRFGEFPCRLGRPIRLIWTVPTGCAGAATGAFTLRAIREWHETTGSGKSRRTQLVHEQQWAHAGMLDAPTLLTPGMTCELTFNPPSDAPGTCLQAEQALFWELEIVLRLPGLDFRERYLVPVYA